jgi:hypothetical protein
MFVVMASARRALRTAVLELPPEPETPSERDPESSSLQLTEYEQPDQNNVSHSISFPRTQ